MCARGGGFGRFERDYAREELERLDREVALGPDPGAWRHIAQSPWRRILAAPWFPPALIGSVLVSGLAIALAVCATGHDHQAAEVHQEVTVTDTTPTAEVSPGPDDDGEG